MFRIVNIFSNVTTLYNAHLLPTHNVRRTIIIARNTKAVIFYYKCGIHPLPPQALNTFNPPPSLPLQSVETRRLADEGAGELVNHTEDKSDNHWA